MNVRVHIERLVLDGLPVGRHEGARVGATVEAELARLLAERGVEASSAAVIPYVAAGSIAVGPEGPEQLGNQIARAVHGGLVSEQRAPARAADGGESR